MNSSSGTGRTPIASLSTMISTHRRSNMSVSVSSSGVYPFEFETKTQARLSPPRYQIGDM